jgi:hypothetical protein
MILDLQRSGFHIFMFTDQGWVQAADYFRDKQAVQALRSLLANHPDLYAPRETASPQLHPQGSQMANSAKKGHTYLVGHIAPVGLAFALAHGQQTHDKQELIVTL